MAAIAETASRRRDPERARQAILDAALAEFGAHGFAGARTAAIAARAGVSTQLITHHFGGKQGLLDELRRRWRAESDGAPPAPEAFPDSLRRHLDEVLDRPDWSRLVLWHALEASPGAADRDDFAARMAQVTDAVRRRQQDGELDPTVDPKFVALLSYLVVFAPLALPDHLRGLLGSDPSGPEYREWAVDQLARLLGSGA